MMIGIPPPSVPSSQQFIVYVSIHMIHLYPGSTMCLAWHRVIFSQCRVQSRTRSTLIWRGIIELIKAVWIGALALANR